MPGGGDSNYGRRRGLEVQPGAVNNVLRNRRRRGEGSGGNIKDALLDGQKSHLKTASAFHAVR